MKTRSRGFASPTQWDFLDFSTLNQDIDTFHHDQRSSDDNHSDIEVISNPSTTHTEPVMADPPKLLYSEVVARPAAIESDIEFVTEPLSPELEFDDEEYLHEVLRSTRMSGQESEEDSDLEEFPPNNMPPAMTMEEVEQKEIVLEVNLTLLTFTVIVGFTGMSGFLLGGIYSAVLTNNIPHTNQLPSTYPGALPSFFYQEEACPNAGDSAAVYRLEENMKHLKQTLSHDIRDCHNKLKTAVRQNEQLKQANVETAHYAANKCSAYKIEIAELQSTSSSLLAELDDQKAALRSIHHQTNSEAARSAVQIATLAQSLENTRVDLEKARKAVSVLDQLNTECRKNTLLSDYVSNKAVSTAKQHSDESTFWKNLYKHAILDLEEAEKKMEDLERSLVEERNDLKESQVAQSNAKISYLKERNGKHYYKNLAEKYSQLLGLMDRKYMEAKSQQQRLGQEFESLKVLTDEMEYNLETCSNASVRAEQRAQAAIKSKEYVETILITRISNDKEEYKILKDMYKNQENIIYEMESQRAALEETLVRKITANRKKFLSAKSTLEQTLAVFGASKQDASEKFDILKSKVGKSKDAKFAVQSELEKSRAVIAEFQEQLELFESYTKQMETHLIQLKEDMVMREAIQREYVSSKDRQHEAAINDLHKHYHELLNSQTNNMSADLQTKYGEAKLEMEFVAQQLARKNVEFKELKTRHDKIAGDLAEEHSAREYWQDSHNYIKYQAEQVVQEIESCRSGKITAIAEYKKTNDMLLDLIQDVASKPKCRAHAQAYFFDNIESSLNASLPSRSHPTTSRVIMTASSPMTSSLSVLVRDDECPAGNASETEEVLQRLKESTGENFSLLRDLYNTSSLTSDLDTCMAVVSPLFPGVRPDTLANVLNMTQSTRGGRKMSTALQKYWGSVDKTYNKLNRKYRDDDDDDDDWYFKRYSTPQRKQAYPQGPARNREENDWYLKREHKGKGQYSHTNKAQKKRDKKSSRKQTTRKLKGALSCELFDCADPVSSQFGFSLCGC